MPREWTGLREACRYEARDKVLWRVGNPIFTFHGGINDETGIRSSTAIFPVLVVDGPLTEAKWLNTSTKSVERRILYARDRYTCCYCAKRFGVHKLTIDHVLAESKGGKTTWNNCVTACKPCNTMKGNLSVGEAKMHAHYKPYSPTRAEVFLLKNPDVHKDQREFLIASVSPWSRCLDKNWELVYPK